VATAHGEERPDERVVSRPLATRLAASFIGGLLTLTVMAITSAALPSAIGGLAALLGVAVVVFAVVRGFRIALVADRQEIVVRNYFRTYRMRWEEIESIGIGFHHMGGSLADAIAIRRSGRGRVAVQATVSSSSERRRVLDALKGMRPDLPIRFSPSP
jgi:Bacterial PH domain